MLCRAVPYVFLKDKNGGVSSFTGVLMSFFMVVTIHEACDICCRPSLTLIVVDICCPKALSLIFVFANCLLFFWRVCPLVCCSFLKER